jgi:nicotinate-nucleotide pyrophosphorylase (carboxylating)
MFSDLIPPESLNRIVSQWLTEDCPSFDVGGFVVGETLQTAVLYAKQEVAF